LKADALILGVIFLFIAYLLFIFEVPWLEFTPLPQPVLAHPLRPFSYLLFFIGAVVLAYAFIPHLALSLIFGCLIFCIILLVLQPELFQQIKIPLQTHYGKL